MTAQPDTDRLSADTTSKPLPAGTPVPEGQNLSQK
jgi:hypothetical protein